MKFYQEPAKQLPIVAETEVLVAGGGPAGIGAALGAARAGAKTKLIENANCLGGMATSGMMSHWSGGTESPLLDEIFQLAEQSPLLPADSGLPHSHWANAHEVQKSVMQKLLLEAGVTIQYHTRIAGAIALLGGN